MSTAEIIPTLLERAHMLIDKTTAIGHDPYERKCYWVIKRYEWDLFCLTLNEQTIADPNAKKRQLLGLPVRLTNVKDVPAISLTFPIPLRGLPAIKP